MKNKRTGKRQKRAILILLLIFFVAVLIVSGWKFLSEIDSRFGIFSGNGNYKSAEKIEYNGKKYKLNHDVEAVLIIGIDKFDNSYIDDETVFINDEQSDLVLLMAINHEDKTISFLHISRDTMVDIDTYGVNGSKNGTKIAQLALSHTYGNGGEKSCLNTCNSVSKLLKNIKINKYVSINMSGVAQFNDLIGGVEVTVMDDFSNVDSTLIKGTTVKLKGEQALTYVRSRQGVSDETNSSRMIRQKQYMEQFYLTAKTAYENDNTLSEQIAKKLTDNYITNCSLSFLQNLTENIANYKYLGISALEGEYKTTKHVEFYPDDNSVTEAVLNLFYQPNE